MAGHLGLLTCDVTSRSLGHASSRLSVFPPLAFGFLAGSLCAWVVYQITWSYFKFCWSIGMRAQSMETRI